MAREDILDVGEPHLKRIHLRIQRMASGDCSDIPPPQIAEQLPGFRFDFINAGLEG
jgi:hypothetical protein